MGKLTKDEILKKIEKFQKTLEKAKASKDEDLIKITEETLSKYEKMLADLEEPEKKEEQSTPTQKEPEKEQEKEEAEEPKEKEKQK